MEYSDTTVVDVFNLSVGLEELVVGNDSIREYQPYQERPETYIVPVLFFLIFIVGVVGNGTLVVVFMRNRAMRNAPNTYILCLALADLLVIITSVPFTSTVYTLESWPFGELVCKMSEGAKDISIGVSVFTLTALSADRFFAIVDPLKRLHTSSGGNCASRVPIVFSILIWCLAILFAIPGAVGSFLKTIPYPNKVIKVCYPFPEEWGPRYPRMIVLFRFLAYYTIPLAIIGVFYAIIARHLILSVHNVPGEMQGAHRQVRARKKVAMTVLAFVVVFALCFLPYHVFMMWFYFSPNSTEDYNAFWHTLRIVGFCLSFLNSCVNPIALYCVSGAFRKHFNRYLLCQGHSRTRTRCDTHTYRRANSMSMTNSRIQNSTMYSSRKIRMSSLRHPGQETSVVLLTAAGTNGHGGNAAIASSNI